ncbi:MAG: RNA-dependent RNA polymerase [Hangzhou narnavirus 2]|nr:MAG: RNA-dependent RNA polymerase [Hangzhou narnavirus 2]
MEVRYSHLLAFRGLTNLIEWVFRSYAGNGEEFVASRLKLMAAHARFQAGDQLHDPPPPITRFPFSDANGNMDFSKLFLGDIARKAESPRALLKLSRVSRAFPPGNTRAVESALIEHRELMLSTPDIDPHIVELFRSCSQKTSRGMINNLTQPGISLSMASSYEKKQREGGAAAELKASLWAHFPNLHFTLPDRSEEDNMKVWKGEPLPGTITDHQRAEYTSQDDDDLEPITLFGDSVEDLTDILPGPGVKYGQVFLPGVSQLDEINVQYPEGLPNEIERVTKLAYLASVDAAFPDGVTRVTPRHNVCCIPDRGGFKVRVVTAGPAALQSLAHQVRKHVYPRILNKLPTMWAIQEDGIRKFMNQLVLPADHKKYGPWVLLSCDMKNATDRFPHSVVEAINDGIEYNLCSSDRTSPAWVAWRSLSGPQILEYPNEEESITTTCGNLMGTAPSWSHLNIYNYTLFRCAWSLWANEKSRKKLSSYIPQEYVKKSSLSWETIKSVVLQLISHPKFHIWNFPKQYKFNKLCCLVGDDLGAACPFSVAICYEILLELSNGKTSPGKHYVQPFREGSYLLIAEEFAVVEGDKLSFFYAEHLRSFSSITRDYDTRQKTAPWAQIGTTLSSAVRSARPVAQRQLCSFAHIAVADWRRKLLSSGLPVYLPDYVGGLGWPHPSGMHVAMERTSMRCLRAYQVIRGFKSDPIQFGYQIARARSTWMRTAFAVPYQRLLMSYQSYFSSLNTREWVSHDMKGALSKIQESHIFGFENEELNTQPLIEVMDKLCLLGVSVGYLCGSFERTQLENPHLEMKQAARRYHRHVDELLKLRHGHIAPLKRRSDYVKFLDEDKEFLERFHVNIQHPIFRETFPYVWEALQSVDLNTTETSAFGIDLLFQ